MPIKLSKGADTVAESVLSVPIKLSKGADKVAEGVVGANKIAESLVLVPIKLLKGADKVFEGVGADKVAERVGAEYNLEDKKPDDRDDEEDGELGTQMKDNSVHATCCPRALPGVRSPTRTCRTTRSS